MIGALTNHLCQSTLFVVAAGLVAAALRKNGAHVRHRIWLVASLKFLVPFSLLMTLGTMMPRVAPSPTAAADNAPNLSVTVDRIAQPFTSDVFASPASATATAATTNWIAVSVAGVWLGGFVVIVLMRVRDWTRVRAALRASIPVALPIPVPVRAAPGLLEPGVIGLFRPLLLVPAGIEQHLTPAQMDAVVAHELCHIARRDNLTSALHMVVEAIFWFYPPVWWVGARLVEERERACDEHVLRVCGEPQTYAESILNVCKLYVESPIACVSGVTGADIKKRITAILVNRVGRQLSLVKKLTLAVAAMLTIALPLAAGAVTAPLRAQPTSGIGAGVAQGPGAFDHVARPVPDNAVAAATPMVTQSVPQKYDVASIKPCEAELNPTGARGAAGGTNATASPGRFFVPCVTTEQLVYLAYASYGAPQSEHLLNDDPGSASNATKIRGGPDWVHSLKEKYSIEATAAGATDRTVLMGTMLQSLLQDRFKLRIHRDTEQAPMYELTVAKGGLKMKPMKEGDCQSDDGSPTQSGASVAAAPRCGSVSMASSEAGLTRWTYGGFGMSQLAGMLSSTLKVHVIDSTGITNKFVFQFEFAQDQVTGASAASGADTAPTGPSVFAALQDELGLKLEKTTGPRGYIVIDHVERPTPDAPLMEPPARARGARR